MNERKDFTKMTSDQILDSFQSENWQKLTSQERLNLIQEMENRNAYHQGREAATVTDLCAAGNYGSYNNQVNLIRINLSNTSPYEVLDTYVHESTHAYQNSCIQKGNGYDEHMLSMMKAETARDANGRLYNYEADYPNYAMQCGEMDSNNKAAAFMIGQKSRFGKDLAYQNYICDRQFYFQSVNTELSLNTQERNAMQMKQAGQAYINGDISEQQYRTLMNDFKQENYEDSAVQHSYSLESQLNDLKMSFSSENSQESGSENGSEGMEI